MEDRIAQPEREKHEVLQRPQRIDLSAGRIGPANIIKRAIRGHLGREQIIGAVFNQRLHLAGIDVEKLNAEWSEPREIAVAIPPNAGGLENEAISRGSLHSAFNFS